MAFPDDDLPDPATWFANQLVTAAKIKTNLTDPINVLRGVAAPVWKNIPLASGFSAINATPQYALLPGGRVELRGGIQKTSGSFATGSTQLATMPAEATPSVNVEFACAATNAGGFAWARVEITGSSALNLFIAAGQTSTTWVHLDGCYYWLT